MSEGGYVSRRLLQLVMPVFPDRRMFRIREENVFKKVKGRMREWLEEVF